MTQTSYSQEEFQQLLQALFLEKKKIKELRVKVQDLGRERTELRERVDELEKNRVEEKDLPDPSKNLCDIDSLALQLKIDQLQETVHIAQEERDEERKERDRYWMEIVKLHETIEIKESAWSSFQEELALANKRYEELEATYQNQKNELILVIQENQSSQKILLDQLAVRKKLESLSHAVWKGDRIYPFLPLSELITQNYPVVGALSGIMQRICRQDASSLYEGFAQRCIEQLKFKSISHYQEGTLLDERILDLEKLLVELRGRVGQLKKLMEEVLEEQESSHQEEQDLIKEALEIERQQGQELRERLDATLSEFQQRHAEVHRLKSELQAQEALTLNAQSGQTDLQAYAGQREEELKALISQLSAVQKKLEVTQEEMELRQMEQKLLLEQLDQTEEANGILIKLLDEQKVQRIKIEEFLQKECSKEKYHREEFQKTVTLLDRKLRLSQRVTHLVYVELQEKLAGQLRQFQESSNKISYAITVIEEVSGEVDQLEKSNVMLYDLLHRYQELFSRVGSNHSLAVTEIEKVEKGNIRIEQRFQKLIGIANNLKRKYRTALALQMQYHQAAREQKELAIGSLLRLNDANLDLKSLSQELFAHKQTQEKLLQDFTQEKDTTLALAMELGNQNTLLDNVKKELLEMETTMNQEIMSKEALEVVVDALKRDLSDKIAQCEQLNERLSLFEKENGDLRSQEVTLKNALKKFYYESKRNKADGSKEIEEKSSELTELQEEHAQVKKKMLLLQEEVQKAQEQLTTAYAELEGSKEKYYTLQEQSNYWKAQSQESLSAIKHLEEEMDKLLHSFAETKGQLKVALGQQRALEQERGDLVSREQAAKAELSHTRRQLEVLKAGMGQQDLSQWQMKMQDLQTLAGMLERENEQLTASKLIYEQELTTQKNQVEFLSADLHAKCEELDLLKAHHEAKIKKDEFQTEAEELFKQKLVLAEDATREALERLELVQIELTRTIQQRDTAQAEVVAAKETIGKLQKQWKALQEEVSHQTQVQENLLNQERENNAILQAHWNDSQEEATRLSQEIVALKTRCEELSSTIENAQLREGSAQDLHQLHAQIESLKSSMQSASSQLEAQARRIAALEEENAHLKEIEAKKDQILNNAQQSVIGKQAQIAELQTKLEQAHEQSQILRDDLTALKLEYRNDLNGQSDLSKEIATLQNNLEEKEQAYIFLQQEYNSVKNQLIEQEFSFSGKDERVIALQDRLKELEGKSELQQQQLVQGRLARQELEELSEKAKKKAEASEEKLLKVTPELEEVQVQHHQLKQHFEVIFADLKQVQDLKDQAMEMLGHTQNALSQAKASQELWKKEKTQWSTLGSYEECSKFYQRATIAENALKELENSYHGLVENYATLKKKFEAREKDFVELTKEFHATSNELILEKAKSSTLKEHLDQVQSEKEKLIQDQKVLTGNITSLEASLFQYTTQLDEQKREGSRLAESLAQKEEYLANLQNDLSATKEKLALESNSSQSLMTEVGSLKSNYAHLQSFLQEKSALIKELELEIQEVKHLLADGAREAKEIEQLYLGAMKEKVEALAKLQQTSDLLAQAKAQTQQMRAELDRAQLFQAQTNSKIEELESSIRKASEEKLLGQQKVSLLEAKLANMSREGKEQQGMIGEMDRMLNEQKQIVALKEEEMQKLSQEMSQNELFAKENAKQKNEELEYLQGKLSDAALQIEEKEKLQKSYQVVANELSLAKTALEQSQAAKLRAIESQQRLEQEFQQHKQMLAKKLKENALLFEAIEKHKLQARELHQQNSQILLDQEAAKMQKEQIQRQVEQTAIQYEEKLKSAQQEAHEWNQKFRYAQMEINEYKARVDSLEKMKTDYQKMRHAFSNLNQFMAGGEAQQGSVEAPAATAAVSVANTGYRTETDGINSAEDLFMKRNELPTTSRKNLFE